jgi:hypothetical protein
MLHASNGGEGNACPDYPAIVAASNEKPYRFLCGAVRMGWTDELGRL